MPSSTFGHVICNGEYCNGESLAKTRANGKPYAWLCHLGHSPPLGNCDDCAPLELATVQGKGAKALVRVGKYHQFYLEGVAGSSTSKRVKPRFLDESIAWQVVTLYSFARDDAPHSGTLADHPMDLSIGNAYF